MPSNDLAEEVPNSKLNLDPSSSNIPFEILNAPSWEHGENLCSQALPGCDIYSVRQLRSGWCVEIEYDNLLHSGTGTTQLGALSDALQGVLDVLQRAMVS